MQIRKRKFPAYMIEPGILVKQPLLLARDSRKATVLLTGWGLPTYALALAIQIIFTQSILFTPARLWIGAAL